MKGGLTIFPMSGRGYKSLGGDDHCGRRVGLIPGFNILQCSAEGIQSLVLSSEFCKVFHNSYSTHRILEEHMISQSY